MSHAITFDTLKYANKLKEAGFTEQQAEIQAETIKEQSEAIKELLDNNIATKADLKHMENELKRDILHSEERTTVKINEINYKLTIRLGSLMVAGIVVLAALIKF